MSGLGTQTMFNAIEEIPIEDRAELQRLLIYKILYNINKKATPQ